MPEKHGISVQALTCNPFNPLCLLAQKAHILV